MGGPRLEDENELRERRALKRARLHDRLDELLDEREALEASVAASEFVPLGGKARATYAAVADFAADVAGELTIWTSLQPYLLGETPEANTIVMLRERLGLAERLMGSSGGQGEAQALDGARMAVTCLPLDISEIREQLLALSRGDETSLFRRSVRKQGERTNQSQLARCQVRALQYDAYMKSQGKKASVRQEEIAKAFGISSWDTIRKWRKPCERVLGRDLVQYLVGLASLGFIEGHGEGLEGLGVEAAGEEYLRVMNAPKSP